MPDRAEQAAQAAHEQPDGALGRGPPASRPSPKGGAQPKQRGGPRRTAARLFASSFRAIGEGKRNRVAEHGPMFAHLLGSVP